uniref:Pro-opiomelanocortin/corticotropin ACTH central region domain-containing protein n=1 Tax=Esox lucius TaxID=8010 RepID=A0A6Q2XFL8_ESOLU
CMLLLLANPSMIVSWLLVVVLMCVFSTGVGGQCCEMSQCKDFNTENRLLDCIHLCKCGFQVKSSEPRSAVQQPAEKNPTFGILLTALTSGEKALEPTGVIADPDPQSDERHSYSMEHFRWGKPMGRKRRPIKVYISSVEGGNSSKGKSNLKARRQLGSLKGNMENKGAHTQAVLSGAGLQDKKKNITYVIDHFRWGFPYTAKLYDLHDHLISHNLTPHCS